MPSVKQDNFFMENAENKQINKEKQNNKKKSHFFNYLYLFSLVFLLALFVLLHLIKFYSPDVDVKLGDSEVFTLNDYESDLETKPIDERLKWIQMEDDFPAIEPRGIDKLYKSKKNEMNENIQEEKNLKPPIPRISEIQQQQKKQNEFQNIPSADVIPVQKKVITKVYLGNYESLEEAVSVQNKINSIDSSISPFVKTVNGHYIVQIGSFSDSERAGNLAEKLRAYGLYAKVNYEK